MPTLTQLVKESTKGSTYETVELIEGNDKTKVNIRKYISLKEHMQLIHDIAEVVFVMKTSDEDDISTEEEYDPSYTNFAKYYQLINYYVDIKNFDNAEKVNELIYKTNIIDEIKRVVGSNTVKEIFDEADLLIATKRDRKENLYSIISTGLSPVLKEVEKRFSGLSDAEMVELVNELTKKD